MRMHVRTLTACSSFCSCSCDLASLALSLSLSTGVSSVVFSKLCLNLFTIISLSRMVGSCGHNSVFQVAPPYQLFVLVWYFALAKSDLNGCSLDRTHNRLHKSLYC